MAKIYSAVLVLALSGCAELNSIYRSESLLGEGVTSQAIAIDAKQRFLLVANKNGMPVYCAEPSPDVFSVFSAALEASGGKADELTAALKLVTAETGGTIGIRTQSIQLLRDAMYRLCEAHMSNLANGSSGINSEDYGDLLKSYQKSMVTLIAVEQLTGAARPAQIVLNSGATINSSSAVYETKQALDKARSDSDKATKAATEKTAALEKAKTDLGGTFDEKCKGDGKPTAEDKPKCEALTKADDENKKALTAKVAAKKESEEWEDVFGKIQNATSLAAGGNQVITPAVGTVLDAATVKELSGQVRELVRDVFFDDFIKTCLRSSQENARIAVTYANEVVGARSDVEIPDNPYAERLNQSREALNRLKAERAAEAARINLLESQFQNLMQRDLTAKSRSGDTPIAAAERETQLYELEDKRSFVQSEISRLDAQILNQEADFQEIARLYEAEEAKLTIQKNEIANLSEDAKSAEERARDAINKATQMNNICEQIVRRWIATQTVAESS